MSEENTVYVGRGGTWSFLLNQDTEGIGKIGISPVKAILNGEGRVVIPDANFFIGGTLTKYFEQTPYDKVEKVTVDRNTFYTEQISKILRNRDNIMLHENVQAELQLSHKVLQAVIESRQQSSKQVNDVALDEAVENYVQTLKAFEQWVKKAPSYRPRDLRLYSSVLDLVSYLDLAGGIDAFTPADRGIVAMALTEAVSNDTDHNEVIALTSDGGVTKLSALTLLTIVGTLEERPFNGVIKTPESETGCKVRVYGYMEGSNGSSGYKEFFSSERKSNGNLAEVIGTLQSSDPGAVRQQLLQRVSHIAQHLDLIRVDSEIKEEGKEDISEIHQWVRKAYNEKHWPTGQVNMADVDNVGQILDFERKSLAVAEEVKDEELAEKIRAGIKRIYKGIKDYASGLEAERDDLTAQFVEASSLFVENLSDSLQGKVGNLSAQLTEHKKKIEAYQSLVGEIADGVSLSNRGLLPHGSYSMKEMAKQAGIPMSDFRTKTQNLLGHAKLFDVVADSNGRYTPKQAENFILYATGKKPLEISKELGIVTPTAKAWILEDLEEGVDYINFNLTGKQDNLRVSESGMTKLRASAEERKGKRRRRKKA